MGIQEGRQKKEGKGEKGWEEGRRKERKKKKGRK